MCGYKVQVSYLEHILDIEKAKTNPAGDTDEDKTEPGCVLVG